MSVLRQGKERQLSMPGSAALMRPPVGQCVLVAVSSLQEQDALRSTLHVRDRPSSRN